MSDHAINLVLLVCALISAPCEVAIGYVVIQEYRRDTATDFQQEAATIRRPFWQWLMLGILSLGPLIALGLVYLTLTGWIHLGNTMLSGTTDVPAGAMETIVDIPVSLPYTVHKLTADWEAAGVFLEKKESGHFSLQFNRPAPQGGGEVEWEVIPRSGSHVQAEVKHRLCS